MVAKVSHSHMPVDRAIFILSDTFYAKDTAQEAKAAFAIVGEYVVSTSDQQLATPIENVEAALKAMEHYAHGRKAQPRATEALITLRNEVNAAKLRS